MGKNTQITDFFKRRVQASEGSQGSQSSQPGSSQPSASQSSVAARPPSPSIPTRTGTLSSAARGASTRSFRAGKEEMPGASSKSQQLTSSSLSSPPSSRSLGYRPRDGQRPSSPDFAPLPVVRTMPSGICTRTSSPPNSPPPASSPTREASPSTYSPPTPQPQQTEAAFLPDLPSSPPTPLQMASPRDAAPRSQVRSRNDEIRGSDEDDSDDSDEFPDIFAPPAPKDVPVPAAKDTKPWETPRPKRRAVVSFGSSPLVPKNPKLDMKKLVAQAKQYEKNDAIVAGIKQQDAKVEREDASDGLDDDMEDILLQQDDSGKLLQAVKRTGATVRKQWRFFDPGHGDSSTEQTPFPKEAAQGKWRFLTNEKTRPDYFIDGIAHAHQARYRSLPNEILLWILDEVPREESNIIRCQYIDLVKLCEEQQIHSAVTESRISQLFRSLGATEEAVDPNLALTLKAYQPDTFSDGLYGRKDWPALCSALDLLAGIANRLNDKARKRAVHILLRLGIDGIVHDDIAVGICYREAISRLVDSIPPAIWDDFCVSIASSFYMKVDDVSLRYDAIFACLDESNARLHQFQRALALASAGVSDLDSIEFDIVEVFKRLDDPEFIVNPDTDYFNLAALASTLSLAIGDGDKPEVTAGNPGVAQRDTNIDAVVQKLKEIESRIHFSSMNNTVSRMAAKSQLVNLQTILLRITRSREPPELGIMASPGAAARKDIPRQRDFMQKFLGKAKARPTPRMGGLDDGPRRSTSEGGGRLVRFKSQDSEHSMVEALAEQIERETASAEKQKIWDESTLVEEDPADTDMVDNALHGIGNSTA